MGDYQRYLIKERCELISISNRQLVNKLRKGKTRSTKISQDATYVVQVRDDESSGVRVLKFILTVEPQDFLLITYMGIGNKGLMSWTCNVPLPETGRLGEKIDLMEEKKKELYFHCINFYIIRLEQKEGINDVSLLHIKKNCLVGKVDEIPEEIYLEPLNKLQLRLKKYQYFAIESNSAPLQKFWKPQ